VRDLIRADVPMVAAKIEGYAFYESKSVYDRIPQKKVLVSSVKGRLTKEKTFAKTLEKRVRNATTSWKRLKTKGFVSEPDAWWLHGGGSKDISSFPLEISGSCHVCRK